MKKYIIAMISLLFSLCSYAQEYKAAVLYEAQGPVKEIRTKSENKLTRKKLKFMRNGQQKTEIMTLDDNGYPIGFGMNLGSIFNQLSVTYDSLQNISKIFFESNIVGNKQRIEVTNFYEGKRLSSRKVHLIYPKKSGYIISEFSDEKYDDYGNWIERTVHDKGISEDGEPGKEKTYIETRTIKYWE
ncbi:MAG: hypothetical protein HDR88_06385 [Bacteroides sp.]|nr:hypothetical protein [Bacteroides sp.]